MSFEGLFSLAACAACRVGKRKCDKQLPKCSQCSSKSMPCLYNTETSRRNKNPKLLQHQNVFSHLSPPTATPDSLNPRPTQPQPADFLAVLFLDSEVSQQFQFNIPAVGLPIPWYVTTVLGEVSRWRSIATNFFDTINEWMPIISKKRFYDHVNPFRHLRADYALLILCMELITWVPGSQAQDARTSTYSVAKRYYLELEVSGFFSLQCLQAYILIALFELGHAIYPSAFLSVAACARYGSALGLDWKTETSSESLSQASWVELEERNRVWWSLALLDRFANIGSPKRALVIRDPEADAIVPSDDKSWDEGVMPPNPNFGITTRINGKGTMGSFGLTAQATRLLGQVLRHVSGNLKSCGEEALLLNETLKALIRVLLVEQNGQYLFVINQQAICHTALVLLHEAHISLDKNTDTALYFESIHQAGPVIKSAAQSEQQQIATCRARASPFMPMLLYLVACVSLRLHQEKPRDSSLDNLQIMKSVLKKFDTRWKSAGAFLKVLHARELG